MIKNCDHWFTSRIGPFTADLALVEHNWTLEGILNNIQETNRVMDQIRYSGLFGTPVAGDKILKVINEPLTSN